MHKFLQCMGILIGAYVRKLQFIGPLWPMMLLALSTMACATSAEVRYPEGNTCDAAGWKAGFPGCLPPSGQFCETQQHEEEIVFTPRRDAQFIAQGISIFPSKEILGPAQPRCPSNATMLVHEMDEKRVKEGAAELGKQVGLIMGKCEVILEALTRNPDSSINLWYATHPETLAQVLEPCASEMAKIPELPQFDDPHIAMAAQDGFTKGYGAGMDEIANRVLIFELAIDTLEIIILPEMLLAEVWVTKAVRASIQGLRRMPLFIPGAVGGLGATVFLKTASKVVTKVVINGTSRGLAKALKLAGKIRLPGEFAHHIVAHGDARAREARAILAKFGIKLDEAVNGVFLPGFKRSPNVHGKAVHSTVHTDAYYAAVERNLKVATNKSQVEEVLRTIAANLEKGIMP